MDYAAALAALSSAGLSVPQTTFPHASVPPALVLSDEQQAMVDAAMAGRDVIVDAVIGSGKTTAIKLCAPRPALIAKFCT